MSVFRPSHPCNPVIHGPPGRWFDDIGNSHLVTKSPWNYLNSIRLIRREDYWFFSFGGAVPSSGEREAELCITCRTLINSSPCIPSEHLHLHLFSSRQPRQTQGLSKSEEWSHSTQARDGRRFPSRPEKPVQHHSMQTWWFGFLSPQQQSHCCLKGMGCDEKVIWLPSERCVGGGEETYIPGPKTHVYSRFCTMCISDTYLFRIHSQAMF